MANRDIIIASTPLVKVGDTITLTIDNQELVLRVEAINEIEETWGEYFDRKNR